MNKIYRKAEKINYVLLSLVLSLYFFIRLKKNFFVESFSGDEEGFVNGLSFFIHQGWISSSIQGTSGVFNFIGGLINLAVNNYLLSLKLVSFISSVGSVFLLYLIAKKIYNFSKKYLMIFILTISNIFIVSSFMFFAYNDNLLVFVLIAMFYIYLRYKYKMISELRFIVWVGVLLGFFLSIRAMSIIYIPSFFIFVYIERENLKIKSILSILSIVTLVTFFLNAPSIIENNTLSYHKKGSPGENVSWTQLQYLSAINKDKGVLKKNQVHVKVADVEDYIKINGEKSLPNNNIEALLFDFKFTLKEFVKDFVLNFKPMTRLSGLLLIFLLILIMNKEKIKDVFLIYFSFAFLSVISFIIISYVESRWIVGVILLLSLVVFLNLSKIHSQKLNWLLHIHVLFLTIMNLSFIINNIKFLM